MEPLALEELRSAFHSDLFFILLSLLLTALLFFLAGYYFSKIFSKKNKVEDTKSDSILLKDLEDCKKKYDKLLISTSGAKIERKASSGISEASALMETNTVNKTVESTNLGVVSNDIEATTTNSISTSGTIKEVEKETPEVVTPHSATADATSNIISDANSVEEEKPVKKEVVNERTTAATFDVEKVKSIFGSKIKQDDLRLIEGIGPKIASILNDKGIKTWLELSNSKAENIREILIEVGGASYKIHDPETWPEQAKLAAEGEFERLKSLQDNLKGGRA